jgi:hypothetical protein
VFGCIEVSCQRYTPSIYRFIYDKVLYTVRCVRGLGIKMYSLHLQVRNNTQNVAVVVVCVTGFVADSVGVFVAVSVSDSVSDRQDRFITL